MILKDISFSTPEENILFDEVLLLLADEGRSGEILRFWESKELFVVLGRTSKEQEDVDLQIAQEENVPILRRFSGGGTVLQGPGCLNYSLILEKSQRPPIQDLHQSYRFIFGKVADALKLLDVHATVQPISDLAVGDPPRKFSGNAQRRRKNFILHHGTILYDFDIPLIEKFLKIPRDVPDYRQQRSHSNFLTNIPISSESIKQAFKRVFDIKKEEKQVHSTELTCLKDFLKTKQVRL